MTSIMAAECGGLNEIRGSNQSLDPFPEPLPVNSIEKTTGSTSKSSGWPCSPVDVRDGPTSPALTTAACFTLHALSESCGVATEVDLVQLLGANRMTIRKWLGK